LTIKPVTTGTLIHGTQRRQDLIPKFCATLLELDQERAEQCFRQFFHDVGKDNPLMKLWDCAAGRIAWPDDDDPVWDDQELFFFQLNLTDDLDVVSPEGYSFGTHPGDGSDYGWWPNDDE